jgi:AcrR family transcriptional regulator
MPSNQPPKKPAAAKIRVISRIPAGQTAPAPGVPESYHHGALREALLDATEQILLDHGMEGFTLRACARRAGVSHGAPAHHFGDVKGLLTEFAARGFERMSALMQSYRERAGPDPYRQMMGVGQAYIDYALAHRAQFQLMFRADRINEGDRHLMAASMAVFDQLDSALAGFLNEHDCFDDAILAKLVLAWSTVHGFASLLLEGRMDYFCKGKSREQFAQAMGQQMLALLQNALAVATLAKAPGLDLPQTGAPERDF